MGSTGHGSLRGKKKAGLGTDTFGIGGAVVFKGKVPANSGLAPVGSNKVTLKVPIGKQENILFQFKLVEGGAMMNIIGYKDGVPEVKSKVDVDSGHPSLDKVIATGTKKEKLQAIKMKDLMTKSTKVDENQLGAIANKLLKDKQAKGGK